MSTSENLSESAATTVTTATDANINDDSVTKNEQDIDQAVVDKENTEKELDIQAQNKMSSLTNEESSESAKMATDANTNDDSITKNEQDINQAVVDKENTEKELDVQVQNENSSESAVTTVTTAADANISDDSVTKNEQQDTNQTMVGKEDTEKEEKSSTNEDSSESATTATDANINDDLNTKNERSIKDIEAQIIVKENTGEELDIQAQKNQPKVPLRKFELILIMVGLALGVYLASLDQTIVSTALPAIASEFKSLDRISWVPTAYLLTTTSSQPTYGKFSDIFGRKATFLFAIIVFELGSLLCGLAPNMTTLIIFRALAGLGGGGIISLVLIMISDLVPVQDCGKYQGIMGAAFGVASVMGPLLGGVFTDHVTWRWAFYVNLPLGAITILLVILLFRIPRPKVSLLQSLKRIDYLGTIVMAGATVSILLALSWGGNKYEWKSPIIIVLLCVGVIGYMLFALVESKFAVEPIAPPHLFKNINVIGCFLANFFQGMAFWGLIYYVPLYFQVVKGDSATQSGLELLPYVLGISSASIISGQIVSRLNELPFRITCGVGASLITIGAGLITLWNEHSGSGAHSGYMFITGFGVGIVFQTTLLCGQQIVKISDIPIVTSLLNFFRAFGAVFGVAINGTVFTNDLTRNLENLSLPPEMIYAVKQSALVVKRLPENVKPVVIVAYVNALRSAFTVIVPVGILCFISTMLIGNHKPKKKESEEPVVTQPTLDKPKLR